MRNSYCLAAIALLAVFALSTAARAYDYTYWGTLGLDSAEFADEAYYVLGPSLISGVDQYGNWYGGDPDSTAGIDGTPVGSPDLAPQGGWVSASPNQSLMSPSNTNGGFQDTWKYTAADLNGDGTISPGEGDYDAASATLTTARFTNNAAVNGSSWDVMMTENSDFEHFSAGVRLPRDLEADGTLFLAGEILIARSTSTINGQNPILGAMLAEFSTGDLYGHVLQDVDGSVPANYGFDWAGWMLELGAFGYNLGESTDEVFVYTRMAPYQVTVGWNDTWTLPFWIPAPDGTPDDFEGDGTPDDPILLTVDRDFYQCNYDYDGDGTNDSFQLDADGDGTLDIIRFRWGPHPKDVFPYGVDWLDDTSRDADSLYVAALTVPEPVTIAIVALGGALLARTARRRKGPQ